MIYARTQTPRRKSSHPAPPHPPKQNANARATASSSSRTTAASESIHDESRSPHHDHVPPHLTYGLTTILAHANYATILGTLSVLARVLVLSISYVGVTWFLIWLNHTYYPHLREEHP